MIRVVVRVAPRLLADALARSIRRPGTEVHVAPDTVPEDPVDVAIVDAGQVDAVDADTVIELKNRPTDGQMAVLHSPDGERTPLGSHRELRAAMDRLAGNAQEGRSRSSD